MYTNIYIYIHFQIRKTPFLGSFPQSSPSSVMRSAGEAWSIAPKQNPNLEAANPIKIDPAKIQYVVGRVPLNPKTSEVQRLY